MKADPADDSRYQEWATEIVDQLKQRGERARRRLRLYRLVTVISLLAYLAAWILVLGTYSPDHLRPQAIALMDMLVLFFVPSLPFIQQHTRTISQAYETGAHNASYLCFKGQERNVCLQYGWALPRPSQQALSDYYREGSLFLNTVGI